MKRKKKKNLLVRVVVLVAAIGVLGAVAARIDDWKEGDLEESIGLRVVQRMWENAEDDESKSGAAEKDTGILSFLSGDKKITKKADYDPERWYMVLVNDENSVPQEFLEGLTLTELSNGERVDTRVYPYLQQMFNDARAQGIYPYVREGFRSGEDQQAIMDERVQRYLDEGHSKRRAQKMAEEYVAQPGTSEHELGIAVDINADTKRNTNDEVYLWLRKNAHKYGFILRYDLGKEEITGTSYEPWHFRYVGAEAAAEMYQQDLCLEEYLKRA